MGLSVQNQVDKKQYFSLSTIDKARMNEYGLTISMNELRKQARLRPPFAEIYTGNSKDLKFQRRTKIYRYEDFKQAR